MAQNFLSDIKLGDNIYIRLGDGTDGDLRLYHNATHSYIDGANTGDLYIRSLSDDVVIQGADDVFIYTQGGEDAIIARGDGGVEIFYDNSKKLETANTGIVVTGNADPATDSLYDLGTNTVRWANVYADTLHGDGSNITGVAADKSQAVTLTVKNKSGGSLSKGTIVHAHPSVSPPSGNVIEVIAADNDDTTKMPAIGILNTTLADEAEGEAIMFGRVSGISTTDDGTSTGTLFSIGDELYVSSTPGLFTNVKPTGTKLIQKIAVVIKSHATNGTIEVFGAGRTNDVPTPIYIDHANQEVGIGQTSPDTKLHITDTSSAFQFTVDTGTAGDGRLNIGHFSNGTFIGTYGDDGGAADLIRFGTHSGDERMRILSDGKVFIGKTSTGLANIGVEFDPTGQLKGTASNVVVQYLNRTTSDGAILEFRKDNSAVGSIGSTTSYLNSSLGIGETNPSAKLEVKGTAGLMLLKTSTGNAFYVEDDTNYAKAYLYQIGGGVKIQLNTNGDSYFNGGNVGIGTATPSRKLDVVGGYFRTSDATSGTQAAFVQGGTSYAYFGNLGSGPAAFGNSENYTTLIVDGENATFAGDVTVGGDLIVNGTTTTINTATVEVEDNILQLNTTQGSPDTATATTSGISIYRGDGVTQASFIFDDADDTWDLTNNLAVAGNVNIENTSSTTNDSVNVLDLKSLSSGTTANGFGVGLGFFTENSTYSTVNEIGRIEVVETNEALLNDKMIFYVKDNNTLTERLNITGSGATFAGTITVDGGQILTPSAVNLALNPNTGVVTVGGVIQASGTGNNTFAGSITTNLSAEGTYFTGGSGGVRQLSITSGTNVSAHALHTFNIASSNGKYEFEINSTPQLTLDSSSATFAGVLALPDGSASAPSIGNTGDTNTGMYWPGDHQLGFAVNGSRKFYMSETEAFFQNLSSGVSINAGGIDVTGNSTFAGSVDAAKFVLPSTGTTTPLNKYLFTNNTNTGTGRLIIQAGEGSAGYGGAINLFSHSHATKPGWVTAGISSGSGGKFSVNTQGLAGGTDVFTVDTSGNATFAGSVETEGPDGGLVLRDWQANASYGMLGTANMANSEYALLTDGTNTFLSGGTSGNVYIRAGNNDSAHQLIVSSASAEFDGNVNIDDSLAVNFDYDAANNYLYLRKHQTTDGGIVFQSKTSGGSTQNDFQILNNGTTGDLSFYAYGLGAFALIIDREDGNATFAGDVTVGALTSGQTAQLVINHEGGATPVAKFMSRTNRAQVQIGDNDTNGYLVAEADVFSIGRTASASANNINIDASHNVGIGTTSPSGKLDIVGPSNGDVILRLQRDGVGSYDCFVTDAGEGAQQLFFRSNPTDSGFIFQTKNSAGTNLNAMIIAPSGNVGIGTTSPDSILQIANNDGSSYRFGYGGTSDVYLDADNIYIRTDNGGSNTATFTTTGLGIGTTSPGAKLDIHTATNSNGLLIREDTDDSITHNFYIDSADNGLVLLYANGQSAKIQLNTAGDSYFDGGNVGIGVTSPGHKLDVSGNIRLQGGNRKIIYNNGSVETSLDQVAGATAGLFTLGNVGIGTATPSNKVHIYASDGSSYLRFTSDVATTGSRIGLNSDDLIIENQQATGDMIFDTAATERMRIESDGKIDISGFGTEGCYIKSKGSIRLDIDADNDHTDRAFIISSNNAASDLITVTETGNTTFAGDVNTTNRLAFKESNFGYSSSYKVVQYGTCGSTSGIALGVDLTGNLSGGFTGNEIVIPNNIRILAPNAANNAYHGVMMFDDDDDLLLGATNYNIDSTYALKLDGSNNKATFTGTVQAPYITANNPSGAANGGAQEMARFVNTASGATSSYMYIGASSGTDWRLGKNIMGTAGNTNFGIAQHAGTTLAMEIDNSNNATFAGSVIVGNQTVTNSTTNYENVLRVKGKNNYDNGTNWYGTYGQILLHSDANMTTSARRFLITNALNNNKFAIVRSVDANTDPVVASTALGINSGTADFVIDSTGLVGIGTTSPTSRLRVKSTGSTEEQITIESSGNTNTLVAIGQSDNGNSSGAIELNNTNGDVGVHIDGHGASYFNRGNVGIGTNSPSYKLQVLETGTATTNIGVYTNVQGAGTNNYAFYADATQGTSTNFAFYAASGKSAFLNDVGIGTTSPDRNLHIYQGNSGITGYNLTGGIDIESTSITGINILSPNAGYGRIYFGAPAGNTAGAIEYIHNATLTSGYMKLRAGAADRMFILGNGNVGIGKTSPDATLELGTPSGTPGSAGSVNRFFISPYSNTGGPYKFIARTVSGSSDFLDMYYGSTHIISYGLNGNVGIGDTTPLSKLEVSGSIKATNRDTSHTSEAGVTMSYDTSNNIALIETWTSKPLLTRTYNYQAFDISGTEKMRINATGVGIGTTSPDRKLHIAGSDTDGIKISGGSNGRYVELSSSNINYYTTSIGGYAMGQQILKNSDSSVLGTVSGAYGSPNTLTYMYYGGTAYNSAAMYILPNKNIGIGTTSPSRLLSISDGTGTGDPTDSRTKLYIDANTEAYMNFNVPTNSYTGVRMAVAGTNKAAFEYWNNPNVGQKVWISAIAAEPIVFATTNTERMRIDSSGRVGINNNSPSSFYSNASQLVVGDGSTSRGITIYGSSAGDAQIFFADGTTGDQQYEGILRYEHSSDSMVMFTSASERMRLDSNGQLGLGVVPPSDAHATWSQFFLGEKGSLISEKLNTGGIYGMYITDNLYVDNDTGNFAYITTDEASAYRQEAGQHQFYTVVSGTAGAAASLTERMRLESDGDLHVDGDVIAYSTTISDKALKDDVITIDNALDKVSKLRGVEYTWNATSRKGQKDIGVIAQEVEEVIPEIVREKEMPLVDGGKYKTVDYEKLTAVLIEAVKELKAEVEQLKNKCNDCTC